LIISGFTLWAVAQLLMAGRAFLCFVAMFLVEGGIGVLTGVVIAGVVTLYHRLRAPKHR
jgi:hypothetical protein